METIKCIKERRSVRKFKEQKVSKDVIDSIVSAASYAPSWKNTQTTRYTVIENPAVKEEVVATKSGYIITNAHVVEYSKDYNVSVILHEDETEYDAVVVGYDKTSDLAILKIEADGLKPAVFGLSLIHI